MPKKNHHDGKQHKHAGRHTTVIDLSVKVIRECEACPLVQKIVAGVIKKVPPSRGGERLKLTEEPNGWKISVRGNTFVQELHVYTASKRKVASLLGKQFTCTVAWAT